MQNLRSSSWIVTLDFDYVYIYILYYTVYIYIYTYTFDHSESRIRMGISHISLMFYAPFPVMACPLG